MEVNLPVEAKVSTELRQASDDGSGQRPARCRRLVHARRSGFTLLELMIVTVIIGILTMVAAGPIGRMREKAMVAATRVELRQMMTAIELHEAVTGQLPRKLADLNKVDYVRGKDILICTFTFVAARNRREELVRVVGMHRGSGTRVTTRYPFTDGMMTEAPGNRCKGL